MVSIYSCYGRNVFHGLIFTIASNKIYPKMSMNLLMSSTMNNIYLVCWQPNGPLLESRILKPQSWYHFLKQCHILIRWLLNGCDHIVWSFVFIHYCDVIMGAIASQITSLTIVYSIVYSGANQKKTSKLRVTGLCAGNSPAPGEFPAQMASNAENVSIWWRHHMLFASHLSA